MANEQNLNGFKKGVSGNPAGRPKGSKNRSTILKKYLELATKLDNPVDPGGPLLDGTVEDKMVVAQIERALTGDTNAFKEIMDSMYGKIPQKSDIDHTSKGEKIQTVTVFRIPDNGRGSND